jgi:protein involved in polysaccharide export with SLBB domain
VPPAQTVEDAVAAAGGVSEQLKTANKALIERCKAALSEDGFKDFRARSAGFMQGGLNAGEDVRQVCSRPVLMTSARAAV